MSLRHVVRCSLYAVSLAVCAQVSAQDAATDQHVQTKAAHDAAAADTGGGSPSVAGPAATQPTAAIPNPPVANGVESNTANTAATDGAVAAPAPLNSDAATTPGRPLTRADLAHIRAMLAAEREPHHAYEKMPAPRAPSDAHAWFMIGLQADAIFHTSPGWKLFDSSRANARLGGFFAHDIGQLPNRLSLAAELGFGIEDMQGGWLNGQIPAELRSQTFYAGLQLRWDALSFLTPQLHAWGGASLFQLQLQGEADQESHAVSGFGALGAGVLLHTPPRTFETASGHFAAFQFGVLLEAGYALRSSIDFSLQNHAAANSIAVVNADLGRLKLSGAYLRSALVVRF
jgi:hypothetical protein